MNNLHKVNNLNKIENGYAKTSSGSINYQHYDNRARSIRSESIWKLVKTFFTDKQLSSLGETEECHVMSFNKTKQKQFSPLQEAA
ncbi:MAG: hypothetical protein V7749_14515 [Cocleimonas sp.]